MKHAVKNFKGVEGRLQYVKTVRGIKIYNDNNATTPQATIACLQALGNSKKNIVLIAGGADKGLELKELVTAISTYCKFAVLLEGTGTEKLITNKKLKINSEITKNLKDALTSALKQAKKGDIVVLSPGFASFGMFINEYDRNDQFMKLVKKIV